MQNLIDKGKFTFTQGGRIEHLGLIYTLKQDLLVWTFQTSDERA